MWLNENAVTIVTSLCMIGPYLPVPSLVSPLSLYSYKLTIGLQMHATLLFLPVFGCAVPSTYNSHSSFGYFLLHSDGISLEKASLHRKFSLGLFSSCTKIAWCSLFRISPIQYLGHTYTKKNIHCLSEMET